MISKTLKPDIGDNVGQQKKETWEAKNAEVETKKFRGGKKEEVGLLR